MGNIEAREETKAVLQMAWPREQNGSMWKLQQESLSNKNTPNGGSPLSRLPLARNAAPAKMAASLGAPRLDIVTQTATMATKTFPQNCSFAPFIVVSAVA